MIVKRDKCDICGDEVAAVVGADGRAACRNCRKMHADYRSHWFVKSLAFHSPGLPPASSKRKPLPGQRELFKEDD